MNDVVVDCIFMVWILLVKPNARSKLRDDGRHHVAVVQQDLERTFPKEEPVQLCLDTFCRDVRQMWRKFMNRFGGALLDREPIGRGKSERSHNTQRILLKPVRRITHTGDFIVPQGFLAVKRVNQTGNLVIGHSVHSKITPCQIFQKARCEAHIVWMTVIGIFTVDTKRRDLVMFSAVTQADSESAVFDTS